MSSWGIQMELIRIAMRTPCHPGEGSLHLAHVDGPPYGIAHSTRGGITFADIFTFGIPSADISHPAPDIRMGEQGVSTSPVRHIRII